MGGVVKAGSFKEIRMKMNCHKKTVNRAAMEAPARHSTTTIVSRGVV